MQAGRTVDTCGIVGARRYLQNMIELESSGFDDLGKDIMKMAIEGATEEYAQALAKLAKDEGLTSTDSIVINKSGDKDFIDEPAIRKRANQILSTLRLGDPI